jgi:plasmid stabilization system protein ParE
MESKAFKVLVMRDARLDVDSIYDYVYDKSCDKSTAEGVTNKIYEAMWTLAKRPDLNPIIPAYNNMNYRKLICGKYVIPYLIKGDTVFVTRVFHGHRDYSRIL